MIKLLIFDWDDVITLGSKEGYYQCYRKTIKEFGIEYGFHNFTRTHDYFFTSWFINISSCDDLVNDILTTFKSNKEKLSIFELIESLLMLIAEKHGATVVPINNIFTMQIIVVFNKLVFKCISPVNHYY